MKCLNIKNKIQNYYKYIPLLLILVIGLVLSFFRWASQDEAVYLHETMIMSEFLRMGQWFGNESVGLHGFLFKLPVAIFYLLTGPNIFIATLFNIILAALSAIVMNRIFNHFLKNELYSLLVTTLIVFSYYYIAVLPTFKRDIPVMFSMLLFIYALIKEKPYWLLGLLFLLVLDAKEYIAIILTPVLILWLPIAEFFKNRFKLLTVWNILYKFFLLFLPSCIYIYLMFFTPVVPVNYFTAGFLQLTASESKLAKVQLDNQKFSFGTDTSRLIKTIKIEDEKAEKKSKKKDVRKLNPVKKNLELYDEQVKRTLISTNRDKISKNDYIINKKKTKNKVKPKKEAKKKLKNTKPITDKDTIKTTDIVADTKLEQDTIKTTDIVVEKKKSDSISHKKIKAITDRPILKKNNNTASKKANLQAKKEEESHITVNVEELEVIQENKTQNEEIPILRQDKDQSPIIEVIISIVNICIVLIQKILSPRIFSYMSFPLYLLILSLVSCFAILKEKYKEPDYLFICIFVIIYVLVFIIRPSHARYLLNIVPFLAFFLVSFFINRIDNYKKLLIPVMITLPITAATLYYEITMPEIKAFAHFFFYSILFTIIYFSFKKRNDLAKTSLIIFIVCYSFFSISANLVASYKKGQIGYYLVFGYNNEYKEIAKYFDQDKIYWMNTIRDHLLIQFYNRDINQGVPLYSLSSLRVLKDWLPKSKMESKYNYLPNFHNNFWNFKKYEKHAKLYTDYIAFLYSERPDILVFPKQGGKYTRWNDQNVFYDFLNPPPNWLVLDQEIHFKNKILFIYKIKYKNL
jgi:hypothetical protein